MPKMKVWEKTRKFDGKVYKFQQTLNNLDLLNRLRNNIKSTHFTRIVSVKDKRLTAFHKNFAKGSLLPKGTHALYTRSRL